jgi:tetratricopeptide (TPR) repeat protein
VKMKKVVFITSLLLLVISMFAQSIQDAQQQIDNENYFKAKGILWKLLNDPAANKVEIYYYLGNAYLKADDADSAKIFYRLVATPDNKTPFGSVAAGRLNLLGKNKDAAKLDFQRAAQISKSKNANVFFEIGDAYLRPTITDLTEAISNLEKANDLDPKNTSIMLELGDAYLENAQNDNTMGGKAMNKYEGAIAINPKLAVAYIKKGQLAMNGRIYDDAISAFNKALEIDPNLNLVHLKLGDAYYYTKQFDKMIVEYKKYIDLSPGDIKARTIILQQLFNNKEYDKVIDEATKGLKTDPNNMDFLRFILYSDFELKRYKDGSDALSKLMAVPNIKLRPRDILYGARLSNAIGDTTMATQLYTQALANDTGNCDLISEYAKALFQSKRYAQADTMYNYKKAKCGSLTALEYYYLGRVYLLLDDSINADTTFGEFIKLSPTTPDGYYWRARTNLKIGKPDEFNSFPWYSKYIDVVTTAGTQDKFKSNMNEAYDYLGAYYFEKDKPKSKSYFQKVLESDPNDEFANEFMKQFK